MTRHDIIDNSPRREFTESINTELHALLYDKSRLHTREEILGTVLSNEMSLIDYFDSHNVTEVLTSEYVKALSEYIHMEVSKFRTDNEMFEILEVGAGDGKLAHYLNQLLAQYNIKVIPTDLGKSGTKSLYEGEVEIGIDYRAALEKYKPQLVICSWMPLGEDWTEAIRHYAKEYILIGPPDGDISGKDWETWGKHPDQPLWCDEDDKIRGVEYNTMPPYQIDGFECQYKPELARLQLDHFKLTGCSMETSTHVFIKK